MSTPPLPHEDKLEAIRLWQQHGRSVRGAATASGLNYNTFKYRLEMAKREGLHLSSGARTIVSAQGLSPSEARGGWLHHYTDDGRKLAATYWRPETPETQDVIERIREAVSCIPPAIPAPPPDYSDADLLTLYPIADAHIGMLSWGRETGEDYDTEKAATRLREWIARAVAASPPSQHAIILDVGDLTHADDQTNMTPRSKHGLDVDTRHYRTVEVTIAAIGAAMEAALAKHETVTLRILPGNHNPTAYLAILFALVERYRDHPRAKVQSVPGEFFVHQFGRCLIAAHHGDKAKADRLVHFVADQYAELWWRARHRYLFTGHLHHHKSQDIGGVQWEQLRALTARDAYAVSHAYTARAQLQGITYHRERGEVMRVKVGQC